MFLLEPYNTFGLKVHAAQGLIIRKKDDLKAWHGGPFIILGTGSDVLFTADYAGTVLINAIKGIDIQYDASAHAYLVRIGGGEILDEVIETLLSRGITGLENLSAIPGTIGAAPIQNAGAYGVEIGDYIDNIECIDLNTHAELCLSREQCRFDYRYSCFKEERFKSIFITHVTLRLDDHFIPHLLYKGLQDQELKDGLAVRKRVMQLRAQKLPDPKLTGNAGSFFKNPVITKAKLEELRGRWPDMPVFALDGAYFKLAAGWLIDKAGCRGLKLGRAGTWDHQALVIVNRGGASPQEIIAAAEYVCRAVRQVFDIDLIPEVRLYGQQGELTWDQVLNMPCNC